MRLATAGDIPAVNDILNHSLVRPTIGGDDVLDSAKLISDGRNKLYFDERGGSGFAWRGPGIFEAHAFFKVRGRGALRAGQECLSMLDYRMVWALVPDHHRAARWFTRKLGFQSLGMMDTPDQGRCELFMLGN